MTDRDPEPERGTAPSATRAWLDTLESRWSAIAPSVGAFERPAIEALVRDAARWARLAGNTAIPPVNVEAAGDAEADVRALRRYARALQDYARALADVWSEVGAALADADGAAAPAEGLGAYERRVRVAEACYAEQVASETFARAQGALVDAAGALAGRGTAMPPLPFACDAIGDRADSLRRGARDSIAALAGFGDARPEPGPREAVETGTAAAMWRYARTGEACGAAPIATPIVVLYAPVRGPDILDLAPRRSLMRALAGAGHDAFLVDLDPPAAGDGRAADLGAYVLERLDACVERAATLAGRDRVVLAGGSLGGTLAIAYAALRPARVAALAAVAAPVDFATDGDVLARWLAAIDAGALARACGGAIPGPIVDQALRALRPLRHAGAKPLEVLARAHDPERLHAFLRVESWLDETRAVPGPAFRAIAEDLYRDNRLVGGTLEIGGERVDLARVTMPVLNVHGTRDPVVPGASATALGARAGCADYTELALDAGHLGVLVGARAGRRTADALARWAARSAR